ncbi:MAG: hypothetical protein M3350_03410 [Actinomycetota bacterium]|nr:hypothetical protein [Actinomycetota bacterium]
MKFTSDEQEKYKLDELMACDAQLMGRVTYEASQRSGRRSATKPASSTR